MPFDRRRRPAAGGHHPASGQGDHLRFRHFSAMLLIVSSLPAMALSFVHVRIALWALALNFAARRAAALH